MRKHSTFWAFVALLLVGDMVHQCGAQTAAASAQQGIVDVTAGQSCAAVSRGPSGKLECNGGESVRVDLSLSPGETVVLDFFTIYPDGGTETLDSSGQYVPPGEDADPPPSSGRQLVGTPIQITVEQSEVVAGYSMEATGDPMPFLHVCHYTAAHERTLNVDGSRRPDGFPQFFVPHTVANRNFYSAVRVRSLTATNSRRLPADMQERLKEWGARVSPYDERTGYSMAMHFACSDVLSLADVVEGESTSDYLFGSAYFNAPFVGAVGSEDYGLAGIYNSATSVCCAALNGDLEGTTGTIDSSTSDDASFCPERTFDCSPAIQFIGQSVRFKQRHTYYQLAGVQDQTPDQFTSATVDLLDDDNDDDGYRNPANQDDDASEDDDESDPRGNERCSVLASANSDGTLTDDEAYTIANNDCENCGFSDTTTAATADFSSCTPHCKLEEQGTGSLNDLDIPSLNGKVSRRKGGLISLTGDDDHDSELNDVLFLDGATGASCNTCNSKTRAYCPEFCQFGLAMNFAGTVSEYSEIGDPTGRILAGTLAWKVPVSIATDDGGAEGDDDGNNGMLTNTCVADCTAAGEDCDPVLNCYDPSRLPGEDDGQDDDDVDERLRLTGGAPWVVADKFVVTPFVSGELFGQHPTAGYEGFGPLPAGRRPDPPSGTYGDTTDPYYATGVGIGDQTNPDDPDGPKGTWIAATAPAFCIIRIEDQPDGAQFFTAINNTAAVPASFLCPAERFDGATVDTIREICNRPGRPSAFPDPDLAKAYDQQPFYICPTGHWDRTGLLSLDYLQYSLSYSEYDDLDTDNNGAWNARVSAEYTGDAVAHLRPYGQLYKVEEKPFMIYKQDITITDLNPDPTLRRPVQHMTVTSYDDPEDPSGASRVALNDDNTIAASIGAIESASGVDLGTYMDLSIAIFNATENGDAGAPTYPYRMSGPVSVTEAAFSDFYPDLETFSSTFWETSLTFKNGEMPYVRANTDLVAILPMPQILENLPGVYDPRDLDNDTGQAPDEDQRTLRRGAFHLFYEGRAQSVLHSGWRGASMPYTAYSNPAMAKRVGEAGACASVLGYPEGVENQITSVIRELDSGAIACDGDARCSRRRDPTKTTNNGGVTERGLIRSWGVENSAAAKTGIMADALSLPTGADAVAYMEEFGMLPYGHFADCGGSGLTTSDGRSRCAKPLQSIQDQVFLYKDPKLDGTDVMIRSTLEMANTRLLATSETVQYGIFVASTTPICTVGSESSTGQLTVTAQNMETLSAEFQVSAECTANVAVGAPQVRTIAPGAYQQFSLVLSHSGAIGTAGVTGNNDTLANLGTGNNTAAGAQLADVTGVAAFSNTAPFTCMVYLTSPLNANPAAHSMDTLTLTDCVLTGVDTDTNVVNYLPDGTNECATEGVDCLNDTPFAGATDTSPQDYFWPLMGLLWLLTVLAVAVMVAVCRVAENETDKQAKLKLQVASME